MFVARESGVIDSFTEDSFATLDTWMEAAIGVFSGQYTHSSDMKKIGA